MTTTRELPVEARRALARLQTDLQEIFGDRLESLVLYGAHAAATAGAPPGPPLHTLALIASLSYGDLIAYSNRVPD